MPVGCPLCLGSGRVPLGFYVATQHGGAMLTTCDKCRKPRYCGHVPRLRIRYDLVLCAECWPAGEELQRPIEEAVSA